LEWTLVLIAIFTVLASELFNTAIEKLADFVESNHHKDIKEIKDLSAGAVLATSFTAITIGVFVFYKYFIALF